VSYSLVEVQATAGETLDSLAARHGAEPAIVRAWNADVPAGPLAAGTVVVIPRRDPSPPGPVSSAGSPAVVRIGATLGVAHGTAGHGTTPDSHAPRFRPAALPAGLATPGLSVAVKDCEVVASVSGATTSTAGFVFTVLPPVGEAFLALPPVRPATGRPGEAGATTSFTALGGLNHVTVSAYSEGAAAPSAIVPVSVPAECSMRGWSGDARLDNGRLIAPVAAERAYLYLRLGDGGWQRLPAGAGSFVDATAGALDFGPLLPALGNTRLELEAWGWAGGKLVRLGAGAYAPPARPLYQGAGGLRAGVRIGSETTLHIQLQKAAGEFAEKLATKTTVDRPGANSTSAVRTLRWSTSAPDVTHLHWQLLPYPLVDATTLAPPFLLDTGTIEVAGLSTGTFSLDLKPYLTGQTPGVVSATAWGQSQVLAKLIAAGLPGSGGTPPADVVLNPTGPWLPGGAPPGGQGGSSAPAPTVGSPDDLALLMPPLTALYLRVIPYAGTVPAGSPSKPVVFDIVEPGEPLYVDTSPPPAPPTAFDAYTRTAVFFAPTGSQAAYLDCVRVVKGGKIVAMFGDWSNGTVHCRPKADDDWSLVDAFEAFAEWVGSVWDYVSEASSWIQDQVVKAVLAFVPCEQVANQVADSGKEVCRKLAKAGLQAVMVSFGIPPEIPSWESAIAAVKGDLKTFILENASALPGVSEACNAAAATHAASASFPTCDAIVGKVVDEAVARIAQERSDAAAASAGVFIPATGIIVEPDPRGMPQPPHFKITVTRTSAPLPAGMTCSVSARMPSTVASWSWLEYQWTDGKPKTITKSGTVTGQPFLQESRVMAPLPSGQSATYELWLSRHATWFEPDGSNDHAAQQFAEWNGSFNHAWVLVQKGASVTGEIASSCFPSGQSVQVLTGQAWQ
jgi:hypothetical protein